LKKKSWLTNSIGWPIDFTALKPFYHKAAEIVQIKPFFSKDFTQKKIWEKDCELIATPLQDSPPTRFGTLYREELVDSKNIWVLTYSTATEMMLTVSKDSVKELNVFHSNLSKSIIRAKVFILATGGLENPRFLLNSNKELNTGIGNQYDLVGHYFMAHTPNRDLASVMFTGPNAVQIADKLSMPISFMGLSKDIRDKNQLLNMGLRLYPIHSEKDLEDSRTLAKIKTAFDHLYRNPQTNNLDDTFDELRIKIDNLHAEAYKSVRGKLGFSKQYKVFSLTAVAEQSPNSNSRVMLADKIDNVGMSKLKLVFNTNPIDRKSVDASLRLILRELGQFDLGRMRLNYNDVADIPFEPDDHHMGTTRMHNDPKLGVVDENCKVHGTDNLYIAGSSVFPSGGFANPTLTIVALSLRLAEHISEKRE
jgi:choline dehydrogenase-like flavoprotein